MTIDIKHIEESCERVSDGITLTETRTMTHLVTEVEGLESFVSEVATYLYACVKSHVDCSLDIVESLIGTTVDETEALRSDIRSLIVAVDSEKEEFFRVQHRDPWILEGLGHLMLKLSKRHPELGPPGEVRALTVLHDDVKDHGLDQVGIFTEQELLAVNIGEAKASENGISAHIDGTGVTFQEVRSGDHDYHIRGKVQHLRKSLATDVQSRITPSFWKNSQAFIAIAGYGASAALDLSSTRVSYERVGVGAGRIRLIAIKLADYRGFFNSVASTLLGLAEEVS